VLLLLLLVSADPEPTAHDVQEALPRHGLEPSGAGARNALRATFVSMVRGLHWARGVEACARSTQPFPNHTPRSRYDSCRRKAPHQVHNPSTGGFCNVTGTTTKEVKQNVQSTNYDDHFNLNISIRKETSET
jgi:hypothetical protein